VSIAIIWLLALAVVRATAHHSSTALGAIQLLPTIALVLVLALLLEAAAASYGPAANDNATGSAVVIALQRAIAANRLVNIELELVLAGAGEGGDIGIRRHLRARRRELTSAKAIVIGIAPCGRRQLHYSFSDGRLIPLRYARPLRELTKALGRAGPHRGRGSSPAFIARARGLAAIALGCVDERGLAPRSHQPEDVEATLDETALDQTLAFALDLVDAINGSLTPARPSPTPA
jgi:hypothetical protein